MSIHVHSRATFVHPCGGHISACHFLFSIGLDQFHIGLDLFHIGLDLFHIGLDQCDAGNDVCNFVGNGSHANAWTTWLA